MKFYKYHGTGNDFIMVDDRIQTFDGNNQDLIKGFCHRRFGIGADGLILLRNLKGFDFEMVYFNADGRPSSMCGNGGRCIVQFAHDLGIIQNEAKFMAIDGLHTATIENDLVSLKMCDVNNIEYNSGDYILDTGSPHYVKYQKNLGQLDVVTEARKIRNNKRFIEKGINVNYIELIENTLHVRTYERGVEDETLSCGTGVTASAIAHFLDVFADNGPSTENYINISCPGGQLKVSFSYDGKTQFSNIFLIGPAQKVFEGSIKPSF